MTAKKISGIYQIRNLSNNKVYIGSSNNVRHRIRTHRYDLNEGKHYNKHLQRAWNHYGKQAFVFKIIEEVVGQDLIIRENWWINQMNSCDDRYGYNRMIAERNFPHRKNYHPSKKTREKMSIAMKERIENGYDPWKGRTITEETRKKLSLANRGQIPWHKGKHLSEQHKENLRKAHLGKSLSEEHKQKLSVAHSGKQLSEEHRRKIGLASTKYWESQRLLRGIQNAAD